VPLPVVESLMGKKCEAPPEHINAADADENETLARGAVRRHAVCGFCVRAGKRASDDISRASRTSAGRRGQQFEESELEMGSPSG
jgi:hypothetical protein